AFLAEYAHADDDLATASDWVTLGLELAVQPSEAFFRLKETEGRIALATGENVAGLLAFRAISDHRLQPAARDADGALDHLPYHIAAAANFATDPELNSDGRFFREMFTMAQLATTTSAGRALNAAIAQRAVNEETRTLLQEQAANRRELRQLDKALVQASYFGQRPERILERTAALQARQSALSEAIETNAPDMSAIVAGNPVRMATIAQRLRPDEVMVVYVTSNLTDPANGWPASFAIALSREHVQIAQIARRSELTEKSAALRCSVALSDPNCGPGGIGTRGTFNPIGSSDAQLHFDGTPAHQAYTELLEPLEDILDGKSKLIIVPDRALVSTPFHLMIREPFAPDRPIRDAGWLIRDMSVEISPSVLSFYSAREREATAASERAFLGIGDPLIGAQRGGALPIDCGEPTDRPALLADAAGAVARSGGGVADRIVDLRELPDTRCELRGISAHFETAKLLLHGQATETDIKELSAARALKRYSVVNFATHGLVAGEIGLNDAGLVLTPPDVPTSEDDGLLTTTEIAGLDFGAELVILSACNTASGDIAGQEGLSGLASAFFAAGAQSLIVSHWPVYSDAAVELTSRLIDTLRSDPATSRAEALRLTMLSILNDPAATSRSRHPSYWGPFMIVGDGLGI
ncbi:MAG: CHAT domain-containing protein, partial [Pseudomonadota bacterium]